MGIARMLGSVSGDVKTWAGAAKTPIRFFPARPSQV